MARKLKYLIIHCTDTPEGREVSKEDLHQWHIVERGWSRLGYADLIHLDGQVENLIAYDDDDEVDRWEISNGAYGYNSISRHVVYAGGRRNKDTRTQEQIQALTEYVLDTIEKHPHIKVIGHNEVSNKYCPSFNVGDWLREIGVDENNIGL